MRKPIKSDSNWNKRIQEIMDEEGVTRKEAEKILEGECAFSSKSIKSEFEIGDDVTLAPRVHILAHDASTVHYLGYAKIGRVIIGNRVFIGASTIVLPNVKIGDDVIVGANSTVTKDLEGGFVYVGSPAKKICSTDEYIKKNKELMINVPCYGDEYTTRRNVSVEKKEKMKRELTNNCGFVK